MIACELPMYCRVQTGPNRLIKFAETKLGRQPHQSLSLFKSYRMSFFQIHTLHIATWRSGSIEGMIGNLLIA